MKIYGKRLRRLVIIVCSSTQGAHLYEFVELTLYRIWMNQLFHYFPNFLGGLMNIVYLCKHKLIQCGDKFQKSIL